MKIYNVYEWNLNSKDLSAMFASKEKADSYVAIRSIASSWSDGYDVFEEETDQDDLWMFRVSIEDDGKKSIWDVSPIDSSNVTDIRRNFFGGLSVNLVVDIRGIATEDDKDFIVERVFKRSDIVLKKAIGVIKRGYRMYVDVRPLIIDINKYHFMKGEYDE